MEGVVGLVSSRIGVNSNDPPCSHDWVAWVATEGTSSYGELSIASPTGYGLTREDPLRGEVEDAAELEIGIAAAWASRALSLGISGGSVRFGDLSETACCILFFPTGRWLAAGAGLRPWRSLCTCPAMRSLPIAGFR